MSYRGLFRMKCLLADGRKVYVSKRGRVHLESREQAEQWLALSRALHLPRAAYSPDLSVYASVDLFLETLKPYVSVIRSEIEPARDAIDPDALILGGALAHTVGTFNGRTKKETNV